MLEITVPATNDRLFDEDSQRFVKTPEQKLQLEHSLISLTKWESKWHKPFLNNKGLTYEETIDYFRCMTLTKGVDPNVYKVMTDENIKQINQYIEDPMTATTFRKETGSPNREQITSELIYYWMISLGIYEKFEKVHLNRLITLIRVFNVKNQPPKKMGKGDIMSRNAALNAARRKKLGTKG